MSSLAFRLNRLRNTPAARLWPVLKPRHFDQVLFRIDRPAEAQPDMGYVVHRFDAKHTSGVPAIDRRLVRDRICYAVFEDGVVLHEVWVRFDALLPAHFGFDFGTPILGDGFTVPHARGRGLQKTTLAHVINDLLASGYKQVYTMVSPHNEPSLRGVRRVGFVPLARLHGWTIAGITRGRAERMAGRGQDEN
ncbi:MAG TPA: hypothetical protein VEG32_01295 [Clostridia bacterium]|nr:hypothetical protein [Clostridia bacterium]